MFLRRYDLKDNSFLIFQCCLVGERNSCVMMSALSIGIVRGRRLYYNYRKDKVQVIMISNE